MSSKIVSLLFACIALISCSNSEENETTKRKLLPSSSGTHAEMLLVVEENIWTSHTGQQLIETFGKNVPGLPQPEPQFSLNRIPVPSFGGLLKRTKSIVFVERSDTTLIETKKNVWAQPQLVTTITAPSEKEILQLIKKNEDKLIEVYHRGDLLNVRQRMQNHAYKNLPKSLADLGIKSMTLQKGFNQTLDKPTLKIFRQETKKTTQFLVFSTSPMKSEQLAGQNIIAHRDSIGKHYFEGHSEGSYFTTETLLPPEQKNTQIDGNFAIETRGLWKTVGYFMGGPFISYTIYNDKHNQIVTIEGFLFGPDAKKRNIILEHEAMIKSVVFK